MISERIKRVRLRNPAELPREMFEARLAGVDILYAEGKSAWQLWAYAFTGNYRSEGQPPMFMADWDDAKREFKKRWPKRVSRERVLATAKNWLQRMIESR
jgi:hypothetical protein